jgi:hypothetical protein
MQDVNRPNSNDSKHSKNINTIDDGGKAQVLTVVAIVFPSVVVVICWAVVTFKQEETK